MVPRNRGHRTSRCGCSGGVSRKWCISPVKQSTTRLKLEWLAFRNMPRRVGQTLQIEYLVTRRATKDFVSNSFFFVFVRIKCQNACLVIHFSTNQMQTKSSEKTCQGIGGIPQKKFLVKMGPNFLRPDEYVSINSRKTRNKKVRMIFTGKK